MSIQSVPMRRSGHPGPRERSRPAWLPSLNFFIGMVGLVLVLVVWELVSSSPYGLGLVKRVQLSSPTLIAQTAWTEITSGAIFPHLVESGKAYFLGLGVALATGIPLGLAIGTFRRFNYVIDPWLSAIYATPSVALIPLIILVFGVDLGAKIVIVWLGTIFEVTVSAAAGVHAAEARFHDVAQSFSASKWTTFRTVTLPASTPFILTGVRLATGRALVGVVVSEYLASNSGIGFYITLNGNFFATDKVFFGIIILGFVGLIMGELVKLVEKRFDRWRPALG